MTLERSTSPRPRPKGEGTEWEVRITVRFDDAGDALASHRQWIFSNRPIWKAPTENHRLRKFETTAQDKNEVGLAYLFRTDRPLDDIVFVYKTPGTIVTGAFDYELKDIKLPQERHEIRSSKSETNSKSEIQGSNTRHLCFEIVSNFELRISYFLSTPPAVWPRKDTGSSSGRCTS